MTLGQAKNSVYYSYKSGEISLQAVNKYIDLMKSLESDGENFNDDNSIQFLLVNRLEKHYNNVYSENHNGTKPKKITFLDSKTASEAISRYVEDVMFVGSETEKYTLTDVIGFDIIGHIHTWYTSYNSENGLEDFVLDYMADSGVKVHRDILAEYESDEENNIDD